MCCLICVQHLTLPNLLWKAWLAGAALQLSGNFNTETLPVASYFFPPAQRTVFQCNQQVWGR